MTPDTIVHLGSEALKMVLLISAPMLLTGLVVGVLISLFQAVTQIQEMTLTFVPKIIVVFVTMIVAGPWMVTTMVDFTRRIFALIPTLLE
ncbi:MAG: flagellar biosynthetic protein FliQ [Zetaproteobacteria bacterium]|nr:MAG: flagellar biosynthetic protein FliQ [Zetaproteobacteria bacterium]